MAQSIEPVESTLAPWVTGLMVTSVILGLITILLSLSDGTVDKALPISIACFVFAVAARVFAQVTRAHRGGATAALIFGTVALGSGLQSALLGTGQI